MKNKGLILLLILLSSCGKKSSDSNAAVNPELEIVTHWINIARDSTQISLGKRKKYLQRASEKAYTFSNDTVRLENLSRISLAYKKINDSSSFREMNRKVLKLSEKDKIHKITGESHWDLAVFLFSQGALDSAYFHYRRAYKNFNTLEPDSTSNSLKARMQYGMGRVQNLYQDYLGAEINITEALRTFEDLEDYRRVYNCNNMLGIIASGMNNSKKSLEYYRKAGVYLDKFRTINKIEFVWENRNNIANELLLSGEYSKAEKAYLELFEDKNFKSSVPKLYSKGLASLAYINLYNNTNYTETKNLLLKALSINDSIGFTEDQARVKQYYAELLVAEGDTINALIDAKKSLQLARENTLNNRHLEVLKLLTSLDNENAVTYSNEYYELSEKIKDEERAIRDKFARIRLETDEVIQKNELLSRQKQIWISVVLGLILFGIALFTIIWQRISNNRLKFQQKQQESNQEIYNLMLSQQGKFEEGKQLEQKRVSEELHDGILGQMLGIRLILSGLNDKDDEASVEQRADLIEKLRELEEEIRTISHELNNASYQKFYNFIVSLDDLINTISDSSGISCSFTYDENVDWDDLHGEIKINAYRIVQESLQNCVKHAKCKNAAVNFSTEDYILKLTVTDDGVGFDINKGKRGIGLRNVISRVKKVKGTLDINSKKGKGTTVTVSLPSNYIRLDNPNDALARKEVLNV